MWSERYFSELTRFLEKKYKSSFFNFFWFLIEYYLSIDQILVFAQSFKKEKEKSTLYMNATLTSSCITQKKTARQLLSFCQIYRAI